MRDEDAEEASNEIPPIEALPDYIGGGWVGVPGVTIKGERNRQAKLFLIDAGRPQSEALVVVLGYLTERAHTPEHHRKRAVKLREAGWRGPIYGYWWPSSTILDLFLSAGQVVAVPVPGGPAKLGMAAVLATAHWRVALRQAKKAGKAMPAEIQRIPEAAVSIVAHSLGGRVTYYALKRLHAAGGRTFNNVTLLGAAMRHDARGWTRYAKMVAGSTTNVYNEQDQVLNYFFRLGNAHVTKACGQRGISSRHFSLVNVDATGYCSKGLLASHNCYWDILTLLGPVAA